MFVELLFVFLVIVNGICFVVVINFGIVMIGLMVVVCGFGDVIIVGL